MPEPRVHRRLAAIMAADVVGYSKMMGEDEAGTLAALKARRHQILNPVLSQHSGRLVKVMGDGVLVEFVSAVDAVQCAVALQKGFAAANDGVPPDKQILLRVGINLGDVIVEGTDIYGEGVNIAARLEGMAPPGGIVISDAVHRQVTGKLKETLLDLGAKLLKNIAAPVQVYAVLSEPSIPVQKGFVEPPPLPDRPSIAVLPFSSMSHDAEQEFFVDGLTEDLITDLSRNAGLFVIARNSTFAYKGKSIDARQIAKEVGVRYLLEGSARRAANRIRVNVQLIDATGGGHLWADRFDRDSKDVFAVQDEVTKHIVEALVGKLTPLPVAKRPANLAAYDLCVRARKLLTQSAGLRAPNRESITLLERAIALDQDYAEAHRWLGFSLWVSWINCNEPMELARARGVWEAERAVELDPNDGGNHWVLAYLLSYERRWEECEQALRSAFQLNPNSADALIVAAEIAIYRGEPKLGIEYATKALRLDPQPASWYFWILGQAEYAAHQYDEAIITLSREETYRTGSRRILAASLAQAGRIEEAKDEASFFMASNPDFTISYWEETQPIRDPHIRNHFVEGYRKAGLPE